MVRLSRFFRGGGKMSTGPAKDETVFRFDSFFGGQGKNRHFFKSDKGNPTSTGEMLQDDVGKTKKWAARGNAPGTWSGGDRVILIIQKTVL